MPYWLRPERPSRQPRVPVIIHVPHAGVRIPADAGITAPAEVVARDQARTVDHATDALWRPAIDLGATLLVTDVSRLACDMERFADDAAEPHAAARGRGVVYTRTADGAPLRPEPLDPALRRRLIARYHAVWHARLANEADRLLDEHGRCWIVDAHSFPTEPLGCEPRPDDPRPDICLGFDPRFTPDWSREPLVALWRERGFDTAVDTPFAGALVPARHHAAGDTRVRSVMVEVRRDRYLHDDEVTFHPQRAAAVQQVFAAMIGLLLEEPP